MVAAQGLAEDVQQAGEHEGVEGGTPTTCGHHLRTIGQRKASAPEVSVTFMPAQLHVGDSLRLSSSCWDATTCDARAETLWVCVQVGAMNAQGVLAHC